MQDPFESIAGQEGAVRQLRASVSTPVHAYLFVGPAGSGKRDAAYAFAGALLDDERALRAAHPDVVTFVREGASINVGQAREITRSAATSPVESRRKVIVLDEFHLVEEAAPALLKTIEEAPRSTVFLILADNVPQTLTTVASRCVRIDFRRLSDEVVLSALTAEGFDTERAAQVAADAHGDLERARLLAVDESAQARRELWDGAVARLDGTGHAAATLTDQITAAMDSASAPLMARHVEERERIERTNKEGGGGATVMKNLEAKHKRELRRLRTDELRAGFAALARVLSKRLREATDQGTSRQVQEGLEAVQSASESLAFNPNEVLLLNALFIRISQEPAPVGARR